MVDSIAGTIDGHPVRVAHHVRRETRVGATGAALPFETWTLVALVEGEGTTLVLFEAGRVDAAHTSRVDALMRELASRLGRAKSHANEPRA